MRSCTTYFQCRDVADLGPPKYPLPADRSVLRRFISLRSVPGTKNAITHLHSNQHRKNSASSSGSGGSSEERPPDGANGAAKAAANFNEAKNQKTVRVQLSRPTEELFPEPGETRKSASAAAASTSASAAGSAHIIDPKVTGASWHPPSRSKVVGAETPGSGAVNDANNRRLGSSAPGVVAGFSTGSTSQQKKQRRDSFQHQHQHHVSSNVESSVFETTGSGCSDRTSSFSCSRESSSTTAAGPPGAVSAGREGDRGALSGFFHKEQKNEQAGDLPFFGGR